MSGISITFGIVAEGPTDVELISQLITHIIPGEHRFLSLQPEISATAGFGAHGAGWKGVLSWCRSVGGSPTFQELLRGLAPAVDVLIIHIDADVAREPEINCARPCPEAADTVHELRNVLLQTLRLQEFILDERAIFCIPSDSIEAWILYAFDQESHHNPPTRYIECAHKPDHILSNPPYQLIRRKDGKPKKSQSTYRDRLIPKVIEQWENVKVACGQAGEFHRALLRMVELYE